MKLEPLKSVEFKALEFPKRTPVPEWADQNKLSDRIFGAVCRINPELPCMQDNEYLKHVFECYFAAGGKIVTDSAVTRVNTDWVQYMKTDSTVRKWRKWYADVKAAKNADKESKEKAKEKNKARKEKYGFALVDGKKEPLQSWIVEPEGIYPGRPGCPYAGYWKFETLPDDVRINTNGKPPVLLEDDEEKQITWKNISWDPNSHFAAQYNVKVGIPMSDGTFKVKCEKYKMIQFAATSSVKKEGQSKKYAAASELGRSYDKILQTVEKDFVKARASDKVAELSTAIAVYMLFEKGIRIGFAGETANGTKGLLALDWGKEVSRVGNKIKFNFIGKDSVKDVSFIETEYADVIEKGWSKYTKLRTDKSAIKAYIGNIVPEIADVFSPKLARTAVAASVMLKALNEVESKYKLTKESPEALKKLAFNEANMEVAKRLNHQRGVNKVAAAKRDEANKLKREALKEREAKVKELKAARLLKIETLKSKKNLKDRKERIQKIREQIRKAEEKLVQSKRDLAFKEENGNITSATSKASYIDPGIVRDWCIKIDLSLEKIYSKSQLQQFSQFFDEGD